MKYEATITTTGEFDNKNYSIFVTLCEGKYRELKSNINDGTIEFIQIRQDEADYYIRKDKIIAMTVKQMEE